MSLFAERLATARDQRLGSHQAWPRCAWNPAASASARSCTRENAVSAIGRQPLRVESRRPHQVAQQLVAVELRHADVAHQHVGHRRS